MGGDDSGGGGGDIFGGGGNSSPFYGFTPPSYSAGIDPSSFSGTSSSAPTDLGTPATPDPGASGTSTSQAVNLPGLSTPSIPMGGLGDTSGFPGGVASSDSIGGTGGFSPSSQSTFGTGVGSFNPASATGSPSVFNTALATANTGMGGGGGSSAFAAPSGVTAPDIGTVDPTSAAANPFNQQNPPTNLYGYQGLQGQGNYPSTFNPRGGAASPQASTGTVGGNQITAPQQPDFSQLATTPQTSVSPITSNNTTQNNGTTNNQQLAGKSNNSSFGGLNLGTIGGVGGVAAAGAGLVQSFLNRNNVPGQAEVNQINSALSTLQSQTGIMSSQGQQLMTYLANGQLPPALQAQIDQASQAAKAQAASDMAARGLPSDPNSNQQLAQQYATIDQQALVSAGQLQQQLYSAGMSSVQTALQGTGLSLQTYLGLQQIYQNQSNQEQQSIGNLAQALGRMGGGGGTTIKIGG